MGSDMTSEWFGCLRNEFLKVLWQFQEKCERGTRTQILLVHYQLFRHRFGLALQFDMTAYIFTQLRTVAVFSHTVVIVKIPYFSEMCQPFWQRIVFESL